MEGGGEPFNHDQDYNKEVARDDHDHDDNYDHHGDDNKDWIEKKTKKGYFQMKMFRCTSSLTK